MIEHIRKNDTPSSNLPEKKQDSWTEEYMRLVRTGNDELILEFLFREGLDKEWADKQISVKKNNDVSEEL